MLARPVPIAVGRIALSHRAVLAAKARRTGAQARLGIALTVGVGAVAEAAEATLARRAGEAAEAHALAATAQPAAMAIVWAGPVGARRAAVVAIVTHAHAARRVARAVT